MTSNCFVKYDVTVMADFLIYIWPPINYLNRYKSNWKNKND